MIVQAIDTLTGKLAAIEASLVQAMPTRIIERGCNALNDRTSEEVQAGVLNLVLDREHDYAGGRGMVAQNGTLDMLLIGYVTVDENTADKADLQDTETTLAEEIKAWVKSTLIDLPEMDVMLDSVQLSRQLEFPYGWVIATLKLGPPRTNVY